MRVRVSAPQLVDELTDFLAAEPTTIVERVSGDKVEVSLLGSYSADAMRMELYLRLRAWEAARRTRHARVEIID